jgi:glycosyltransferase involved in cell wall biosynthesis
MSGHPDNWTTDMHPAVSVLLPTRARPASLQQSIRSLRDTATHPDQIEILTAVDADDPDTQAAASALHARTVVFPERLGYARLHAYVNTLAAHAAGRWLLLWNDDATMKTPGWDLELTRAGDAPYAVALPRDNTGVGSCFPAITKPCVDLLGHVSLSPHCDTWIQDVGERAGISRPVDIDILHDRYDLTGGHDDATYREGRAGWRTLEYFGPSTQALLDADAAAIREAMTP